jgi:predicted ATPase/DNA-binding SARP family transcriptional activator
VEIRLLGALEVLDDKGNPVALPGAKLRALLAALALRPGQVVSSERLVEELWGPDASATAANSLQVLVFKLRRALPREVVMTRPTGYLLDQPAEAVDIGRFDALTLKGRKALAGGDADGAGATFRTALALWRGPALAEFVYEEFAQTEVTRLGEERASVFEDRVDADLVAGRHAELVAELEAAVSAGPLRERLRGQLMLALYRSGRQADALRQFQEARRVLGEELGLEPGPELRRLEAAILTHDPEVASPTPGPVVPTAPTFQRTNIRPPSTETIGRASALVCLAGLTSSHRLVTVVGPGGVGKTRLAIETGLIAVNNFRHGAWLVEVAPLRDPGAVVPAIAGALGMADVGVQAAGTEDALARLSDVLIERELLLILDNCEHLVDQSAAVVEGLLAACPRLRILVTTREAMALPGELVWPTPALAPEHAVELFAARAGDVTPTFVLSDESRPIVMNICTRLDGLPLAIELAAARARTFPVAQIAERLDDRFGLLTRGARTATARQQTLRAVVDWSYDLLCQEEQRLFNRMSVFVDGCDLDAVEAVCADDQLPAAAVADLVSRLVDKSLVEARDQDGQARFSMLQTLTEYGRKCLAAEGECALVKSRHAGWYGALAERGLAALLGRDQRRWGRSVSRELGNLEAAIDWAVEAEDAQLALTIAGGLGGYWWASGHPDVGIRWLDAALGCRQSPHMATRALAQMWAAYLSLLAGRPLLSTAVIDEAMDGLEQAGELEALGLAKMLASQVYAKTGAVDRVTPLVAEARDIAVSLSAQDPVYDLYALWRGATLAQLTGDDDAALRDMRACLVHPANTNDSGRATILGHIADICEAHAQYEEAATALEEARRLAVELGMSGYHVPILARLADLAVLSGDTERADVLRREAIETARHLGYTSALAVTLAGIATRQLRAGNLKAAAASAAPALVLYREADDAPGSALALIILGWAAEQDGDATGAAAWFARGLAQAHRAGDSRLCRDAAEGLAAVALRQGEASRAARLLGAASRFQPRRPDALPDTAALTGVFFLSGAGNPAGTERTERSAREAIGPAAFAEAFAAGGPDDLAPFDELATQVRRSDSAAAPDVDVQAAGWPPKRGSVT